ncbi:hypothetical protein BGW38_006088 [Lunasporangiospora selenospora]|uniref:Uncharacterized protein n=1 Tax=Lunasporangiospora selenospora TaxID=979761 RepID=A0A9P6G1A2_9FUNG|nr:hypothetical protein BGW38_006088 [Lunasporangiospora selenospora]
MTANLFHIKYNAPVQAMLVHSTIDSCECSTCQYWVAGETIPFADNPQMRYGLYPLSLSTSKAMSICPNHLVAMNLVRFDYYASSSQAVIDPSKITPQNSSELDLVIHGSSVDTQWTDDMIVNGQRCEIQIRVASANTDPATLARSRSKMTFIRTSPGKGSEVKTVHTSTQIGNTTQKGGDSLKTATEAYKAYHKSDTRSNIKGTKKLFSFGFSALFDDDF